METITLVTREIVNPASSKFTGIGKRDGFNFDKLSWVHMEELDCAVTRLFRKQNYNGNKVSFIPDYGSFNLNSFFGFRHATFPWLEHLQVSDKEFRTTPTVGYVATCPFETDGLFVPMRWAMGVLILAREGITHFENGRRNAPPIGMCWLPHVKFKHDRLAEMILKGGSD